MIDEPRTRRLILASASDGRQALLSRLGVEFTVQPADIDETPAAGESPAQLVERLSREKAAVVAAGNPDAVVIGSDQVAVLAGEVTGKPGTDERAAELLGRFSGRTLNFITGVALVCPDSDLEAYLYDRTEVVFRELGAAEIERYIHRDRPLDCAGCFRLEAQGPALFDAVRGTDPTALMGLPLIGLTRLLRQAGYPLP